MSGIDISHPRLAVCPAKVATVQDMAATAPMNVVRALAFVERVQEKPPLIDGHRDLP